MNVVKMLKKFGVVAAASVLTVSTLAGCSGGGINGVAATVNGTDIKEEQVTTYIQNFREQSSLTEEAAWGEWMSQQSLTPEDVRKEIIDYYADIELVKKAAEENGVSVSDDDINTQVESMKSRYDNDEAWQQALSQAGTTEDAYRENIRTAMLEQALQTKIAEGGDAAVSDEDVLASVQQYASYYDGTKRSSHILFSSDDTATAQSVLDQINAGTLDFADAAKQYSTDPGSKDKGGDVGWGIASSFAEDYSTALSELSVGQVSGLVSSQYGIHIIKCTEEFTAPETVTDLSQVPDELVTAVRSMLESQSGQTAFTEWFNTYKENNPVDIKEMPKGLPYDLDMSKYPATDESSDSSEASSDTATNSSEASSEATAASSEDAAAASAEATTEAATTEASTEAATTEASEASSEASSSQPAA